MGAVSLMEYPSTKEIPAWLAIPGVGISVFYLLPEFVVSGALLLLLSVLVFFAFGRTDLPSKRLSAIEYAIAFLGLCLGVALEFPAVLNNPVFAPLRETTLLQAYIALGLVITILSMVRHSLRGAKNLLLAPLPGFIFVILGWGLTQITVWGLNRPVNRNSIVILGVDSLGYRMQIGTLQKFAKENGGTFYDRAVTPGLLTNAVWTAIIEHRPVHDTGVLLTFQTPDWSRSPYHLITEAKQHGYQTWSFISSQNTAYAGSLAGFDHDESGPMGWLQNATASFKNGSVILPFLVSRLPRLPFSRIPQNQSGTYAYDLRAQIRDVLSSHEGLKPVFAIGHLEYLHEECYPRFADLPSHTRSELMGALVHSFRDFGGDWQSLSVPDDLLNLRAWKVQNVQKVLTDEIGRSGFIDSGNSNKLVILADHGLRWKLSNDTFSREAYYHVPLITFGIPRRDVSKPISLLEISSLVGLDDHSLAQPTIPIVEYVNFPTVADFKAGVLTATWKFDGSINMSADTVKKYRSLLQSYQPFLGENMSTNLTEQRVKY